MMTNHILGSLITEKKDVKFVPFKKKTKDGGDGFLIDSMFMDGSTLKFKGSHAYKKLKGAEPTGTIMTYKLKELARLSQ